MAKKPHSYNSGRIYRAGSQLDAGVSASENGDGLPYLPPPVKLKKRRKWPFIVMVSLLVLVGIVAGLYMGYYRVADQIMDPGLGVIRPIVDESTGEEIVPQGYKGVAHILVLGIDYEEGRYNDNGLGLTDMILYIRFDTNNNTVNMLQIPRDSYVGDTLHTGGSGKINALLLNGPDQENPINNIVDSISRQFLLPVDYYVALDMQAMATIVDTLGGLRVYVPHYMEYNGGFLNEGWQWLDGHAAEFFVRTRKGSGFSRGDIDRLDVQRHFYSALFRRFLNLTPGDVVKMMPIVSTYCMTNIDPNTLVALGVSLLGMEAENIMMCKAPGATGAGLDPRGPDASGNERSLYVLDLYGRGTQVDEEGNLGAEPGLATLLNLYFREPGNEVPASALGLPQIQIPYSYALYTPNVQWMASVQETEGGEDVNVEHTN